MLSICRGSCSRPRLIFMWLSLEDSAALATLCCCYGVTTFLGEEGCQTKQ